MTKLKKYKLTNETKEHYGITLHRIEALKDFGNIKNGDLGGWVEKEENLSQVGNCWVSDDAKVYDDAQVFDGALVFENAEVYGNARVFGNARVYDLAMVFGNARVCGNAWIFGDVKVFGNTRVFDNTRVFNNARVSGDSLVFGYSKVSCNASVCGNVRVSNNAQCSKTPIYADEFKFPVLIDDFHVHVGCKQFKKGDIGKIKYAKFKNKLSKKEFNSIKKYVVKELGIKLSLFERICNLIGGKK